MDFVEKGTGKRDGIACTRAIAMRAKFGKDEMPAFVIVVEVEREGKAAVGGCGAEVVAVGAKEAAVIRVVTGDFEALESRGFVVEGALDFGHDAAAHRGGQQFQEFGVGDLMVSALFVLRVDDVAPRAGLGAFNACFPMRTSVLAEKVAR